MSLSFVITARNDAPYIDACLNSVIACARGGDQVLIVDEASEDGTPLRIAAFREPAEAAGLTWQMLSLSACPPGGGGLARNAALDRATGSFVAFVDGSDWLDQAGFTAARAEFENSDAEVMIANGLSYDHAAGTPVADWDQARWSDLTAMEQRGETSATFANWALGQSEAPWRKLYRLDFLRRAQLRFGTDGGYFDDVPFHWQMCLSAKRLLCRNRILAFHRINRPDGARVPSHHLGDMFDAFDKLIALLPPFSPQTETMTHYVTAAAWLVRTASAHGARIAPEHLIAFLRRGKASLAAVDPLVWEALAARPAGLGSTGDLLSLLPHSSVAEVASLWHATGSAQMMQDIRDAQANVAAQQTAVQAQLDAVSKHLAHAAWQALENEAS